MIENRYTNIKVGLVTTVAFIVLIALFTWKSGTALRFSGYEVIGEFQNVGGLLEESEVRYRGYNVGKVNKIVPRPDVIQVYVKVKSSIVIPNDSKFRIAFDGLIGQKYLEVIPGFSKENIKSGDSIPGYSAAGIVDFIDEGAKSMQEVQKVLIYVRKFLETEKLQSSIANSAQNLEEVTKQFKAFAPRMNKLMDTLDTLVDKKNVKNINNTIENISASSEKLNKVLAGLENVTNENNQEGIQEIIKNIREITNDLNGKSSGTQSSSISDSLKSVKRLSSIKVGMNAGLFAVPDRKLATGRAGIDLGLSDKNAMHFGLKEDLDTKQIDKFSITGENSINDQSSYHYGIIDSQLGAGYSYDINDRIQMLMEVYQPSDVKGNIQASYALDQNWQIITAAEKINRLGSDAYVGFGYKK